jgi:hypothetical protein
MHNLVCDVDYQNLHISGDKRAPQMNMGGAFLLANKAKPESGVARRSAALHISLHGTLTNHAEPELARLCRLRFWF